MIKRLFLAVAAACLLSVATTTRAEFPLKLYRSLSEESATSANKKTVRDYVVGVGRGIFWANVTLGTLKKEPLFCMPGTLALDAGIIESLLDQGIREEGKRLGDEASIELILTRAFVSRFPCEKK